MALSVWLGLAANGATGPSNHKASVPFSIHAADSRRNRRIAITRRTLSATYDGLSSMNPGRHRLMSLAFKAEDAVTRHTEMPTAASRRCPKSRDRRAWHQAV